MSSTFAAWLASSNEDHLRHRRAKIVSTIGPASNTENTMRALMRAGMDVARLNFSHGTHQDHAKSIERLRRVAAEEGRTICILQDLQGPKIRTGGLRDGQPVMLKPGARVTITTRNVLGTPEVIATTFQTLPAEVEPGSRILLSDGKLALRVLEVEGTDVICEVIDGGLLGEHQGINLPGAVVTVPSMTPKDHKDLQFGIAHGVDVVAVSFVRTAADVQAVKDAIAAEGSAVPVIAKLEKPQAIDNLEKIFAVTDGVMVARGDLGVEVPPEKVPIIQKHVIRRAMEWRKPVITATQMLESMIQNPRPTRAEASDVANAIFDGTDAVMLSGETATGKYPVQAVAMMARIIIEAEEHLARTPRAPIRRERRQLGIAESICESAAHMAEDLNMGAIAVFTQSGNTARLISKYRPRAEVYAFAHIPPICNRLNLYWGVHPVTVPGHIASVEEMVRAADERLQSSGVAKVDDVIAIVAGTLASTGSTNFIRLHRVRPVKPASESTAAKPARKTSRTQGKTKK